VVVLVTLAYKVKKESPEIGDSREPLDHQEMMEFQ
jgi:hypothetical protein